MKTREVIKILKQGGVGVMPTDTLYGLVGSAFSVKAVKRVRQIKGRRKNKPFIILITSLLDLKKFKVKPSPTELDLLKKVWPGPSSVVLSNKAFRLPNKKSLIKILRLTGPLIAPSANTEGKKPAKTIREAKKYFGNQVDFYLAGRRLENKASTLIKVVNGKIKILRQGSIKIKKL